MKVTRYGVLNDIHGPYHDPKLLSLVLDIFEDQKLDGIYLNGDIFDFANICRHGKKSPDLRTALEDEFYWGNEFFDEIRERFVKKGVKVVYNAGNHEEWLDAFLINHARPFWNLCRLPLMVDLSGIDLRPYNEAIQIEKTNLWVQHSPPSYAKTGPYTALKERGDASYIWGCTHRLGHAAITGGSGKQYHAWFNGWLGNLELKTDKNIPFKYTRGHNAWQHGACIVDVVNGKSFFVQQFAIQDYRASVAGVLYEA